MASLEDYRWDLIEDNRFSVLSFATLCDQTHQHQVHVAEHKTGMVKGMGKGKPTEFLCLRYKDITHTIKRA